MPAIVLEPARVQGSPWPATVFRGIAHDTANVLTSKLLVLTGSIASVELLALSGVGLFYLRYRRSFPDARGTLLEAFRVISRLLLPPAAILAAALLTEMSWVERSEALLFRLPRVWPVIFILAALSPLLLTRRARALGIWFGHLPDTRAWRPLLALLLVTCGVLRVYKLDFQPLDDDEYASCQAIVGITETGAPRFVPEGVYYTRSPAYHYLMGGICWVFGLNLWAMRLPCAAFGVATALVMIRMCERLLRRPWVGFGAALLFTLHPFTIFSSHLVRFYQQQQFFSLVAVYFFCRGFLGTPSAKYRDLTILAFLLAALSQELTVIMTAQLLVGMFWFGRDAGWRPNLRLAILGSLALGFIALDLIVFQTRCLTRTEGVSPNLEATIRPHFWEPFNVLSLFLGYSRLHVAPSLVLLLALSPLVRRGGRVIWALGFFVVSGVLLTNLMVSHVGLRYQYWMIPLWLILSVRGLELLCERLSVMTRPRGESEGEARALGPMLGAPVFLSFLLAWSPWRIPESYDCKLLNDSTGAFRHVRSQLRPGDAIATSEPHPHAAFLEVGRVDYDLAVPLLHDFLLLRKGRLLDRNGGAETISSLNELMAACRRHERLWIVVNREKFRTRGKNLRWEYPAARIELFLRRNCQVAHRDYLWTVFLWDRSKGTYDLFRES